MADIIFDTDIGTDVDDLQALLLALKSPEITVKAVTTVDREPEKRALLALRTLEVAGRPDIPVAVGMASGMMVPGLHTEHEYTAYEGHGVDLSDVQGEPLAEHAVPFMIRTVMEATDDIYIVAVGPLSNLGMAFSMEPRMAKKVKGLYLMGGCARVDETVAPRGEHNFGRDAEAASLVLNAGVPTHVVGIDVTRQVPLPLKRAKEIKACGTEAGRFMYRALRHFHKVHHIDANLLHDPLCLASFIRPDLVKWEPMRMDIETEGRITRGLTISQKANLPAEHHNVRAAVEVNTDAFVDFFVERLTRP